MRARLVASDSDANCAIMDFEVDPHVIRHDGQFIDAARNAVKEFLATEAGEERVAEFGCFGWGDAIDWVPMETWTKYGLKPVDEPTYLIGSVDYNEDFAAENCK